MTDSVRCTKDAANQFTCDVQIDSHFDAPDPPSPPETSPAVTSLVSIFTSKTLVTMPATPLLTAAGVKECASSEFGMGLAVAARVKNPVVHALLAMKAAVDTIVCLADVQKDAAERTAESYCLEIGGAVTSVASNVTCEVQEKVK
jgi:hypothetical protein